MAFKEFRILNVSKTWDRRRNIRYMGDCIREKSTPTVPLSMSQSANFDYGCQISILSYSPEGA
jgi:hypothetical protein